MMMKLQHFSDIEKFLEKIRPDIKAVNWFFALGDMQKLMHELGDPQEKPKIVHVAGTSGKTSTSYYMSAMLQSANQKVGLTVSPHVDSVSERAQINSQPLPEKEFVHLFDKFTDLPALQKIHITYFGMLVAFAFWVFAQKQVDYAVIEVGMGGRIDATNLIQSSNKIVIITDIGLDHTKFLGKDLPSIAREKAGIIRPNNHVFVAKQSQEIMEVFARVAYKQNAVLHILPDAKIKQAPKHLPPFQKRNWALARFAFDYIAKRDHLEYTNILATADSKVPARMEAFTKNGKTIITDGSHNAQKIGALVGGLQQIYPGQKFALMTSLVSDKDVTLEESLQELHKVSDTIIVTTFSGNQDTKRTPMDSTKIAEAAHRIGFKKTEIEADPRKAFELLQKQPEEHLLITGSFFLLNHVRPLLL